MNGGHATADWRELYIALCLMDEFPGVWGDAPGIHGPNSWVIRSTNLDDDGHVDFGTAAPRRISLQERSKRKLQAGDLLLEASGGGPGRPVGRIGFVTALDGRDYLCSNFLRTLRPDQSKVDPKFLAWRLLFFHRQPAIWNLQQQTTGIINLKLKDYLATRIWVPFPPEQRRIASALDAVDAAIERTAAVVAKLRQMRIGLVNDLLTRGLDSNGEIRDPLTHPAQFTTTPDGLTPKEWLPTKLRECLTETPRNGIYKPARQIGQGTLLVGQTAITKGRRIDPSLARRAEISAAEIRAFGLEEGDVLISRVFATLDGVGQPSLVPSLGEPAVYESNMMRMRVNQSRITSRLLFELLRHARVRAQVVRSAHLSNQASVNQAGLNPIVIHRPSVTEQGEIVRRVEIHDDAVTVLMREERKLRQLKTGLMSDLLTGSVPVPETIATGASP